MAHRPWHKGKNIRDITYDKDIGWQIGEHTWSRDYPWLSKVLGLQYGERFGQFVEDFKNTPSPSRSPVSRNIEALVKSPIVQEELPEALSEAGKRVKKWGSGLFEGDRISYGGMGGFDDVIKLKNESDLARARALFDKGTPGQKAMSQKEWKLYLENAAGSELQNAKMEKALLEEEKKGVNVNTANTEDPNEKKTSVDKSLENTESWYQRNQGESEDDYQARLQGLEEQGNPDIPGGDADYGTKGKPSGSGPKPPGIGSAVKDHLWSEDAAKGAAIGAATGLMDYIKYWSRYS